MDTPYTACSISEDGFKPRKCPSLKKLLFKGFGLILICLLSFGTYFCYDNPAALQDKFYSEMNMTTSEFTTLYAVYSWPNVILCVFGGFLLDSVFGVRWGTIIYLSVALSGQLLFAFGTFVNKFWLMVLGRFVYGVGAESINAAQNSYTFMWFGGKALNTLFGLQWSFTQVGSTINALSMEKIHKLVLEMTDFSSYECLGIVLFLTATMCLGSMMCALLLSCMHSYSGKVAEHDNGKQDNTKNTVKLSDVKDFKLIFWLIVFVCSAYCVATYPFITLAKMYFMTKYAMGPDEANGLVSLIYTISAITSPLFGIVIDLFGKNSLWLVISVIGSSVARVLLSFTNVSPLFCMVIMGLSISIFVTSSWPMIAQVMPVHQLGTAYGINQAVLNLSVAIAATVCGLIVDNFGYFILDLFFLAWHSVTLVLVIMIWMSNQKSESIKRRDIVVRPNESKDILMDGSLQPLAKNANVELLHS